MSINEIIVYIMVLFMALGAVDRIIGNRFGLGEKFEEGIIAMGSLALSMIGIICLAPVLAGLLRPVVVPLYSFLGADPAMFAGTILANDMGGAPLAKELALTPEAGQFGGLIVGSMLGPTVVFTIPVALGIIRPEDHEFLAKGVLAGVITIPIGGLVGVAGSILFITVVGNVLPINWYFRRHVGLDVRWFWVRIARLLPSMLVPAIVAVLIAVLAPVSGYLDILIWGCVFVAVYAASLWLFGMNRYERGIVTGVLDKFRRKRRRRA